MSLGKHLLAAFCRFGTTVTFHTRIMPTEAFATNQTSNPTGINPQRIINAQRDTSFAGECRDNKQSPTRSIPSSSDHNQDAVSPLPTEIDATGSTSHEEETTLKQNLDLLSDCSLTKKNLLCSEIATYLQVKDCDEHRDANQGSQVSPASSLLEFAGTPEQTVCKQSLHLQYPKMILIL